MRHLKSINKFKINEEIDIVNQREISIVNLDEEISHRELWELEKWSFNVNFDRKELTKLNLYFGIYKEIDNNYNFNLNFGGFGKEKIRFNGVIKKLSEYDSQGRRKTIDAYFLIKGHIKIKMGVNEGNRQIFVKLKTLSEVIKFIDTFENRIKMEIN